MNLTEQYCALRALARSGRNLMLLWGDWSLHGLQAIPGMHGRFDERPCPAESARSPTADRAEPIRTPRNVAGNLPLPDADVPVPCTTCRDVRASAGASEAQASNTRSRDLQARPQASDIRASPSEPRRRRVEACSGTCFSLAREPPRGVGESLCLASRCFRSSDHAPDLAGERDAGSSAIVSRTWACCIVASASGQGRQATQSPGATCWTSIDLSCAASRSRPGASSASTYSFMPVMP